MPEEATEVQLQGSGREGDVHPGHHQLPHPWRTWFPSQRHVCKAQQQAGRRDHEGVPAADPPGDGAEAV